MCGSGFAFEFVATASQRYRFELEDDQGLSNPDPGLFAIDVVDDQAPEIALITPRRSDVDTVLGGIVPVRARAEDDFGLVSVGLITRVGSGDELTESERLLELRQPSSAPDDPAGGPDPRRGQAATRIDVAALLGTAADAALRSFELELTARDSRAPEANVGRSSRVGVRVISPDELLRRVQDRLARARLQASELADLQRGKRADVEDLLDALKGDSLLLDEDALALQTAVSGQRRVLGDARSLSRELASIAEAVVYARLDDKAGALLERLDRLLVDAMDQSGFPTEAWRELGRDLDAGSLGSPGFAGHLVELVSMALAIETDNALPAAEALDASQNAVDAAAVLEHLANAAELQGSTLQRLEDLLERLAEWDNFQSVLLLTRDILNRQEALLDRTKRYASGK